jgi:peptidoglycan/xylan/chitin deacetylase (PgdA/CDA1 family)
MIELTAAARAHVDAFVRRWLALPRESEAPTLPDALSRRLLRCEEYERPYRDQWGNWEFGFAEANADGRLWEPDVDRWLQQQLPEAARNRWPGGRPFAICLSHDVDLIAESVTARQTLRSMRLSLLDTSGLRFARPAVRFARALHQGVSRAPAAKALERCVEIEQTNGITATYFFTAYPGSNGHRYDCTYDFGDRCRFRGSVATVADVMRTLAGEGFDIGLHGSYNSAFAEGQLARERKHLERATGLSVTSTRQHFLHWDVRTTPRLQSAAGFSLDSTVGFNRNIGFRAGTSLPFRWFDVSRDTPLDLVELPMLVHDGALLRPDALELGPELAQQTVRDFVDRVADVGGVATFVFHPNNLERDAYLALFETTIAHGIARDAWFASARELDAWFRDRER